MNILCIDTTTIHAGVTVIRNQESCYKQIEPMRASETLLKTIDECLKKRELKPSDLTGILVIKGPGSFTGLRVGIAIANQFAHQLKIPILGLKTDEWWKHRTDEEGFLYLQSMNRGEVYVKKEDDKSTIQPIENLESLDHQSFKWLGQLNQDHQEKLPSHYQEIVELFSVEETWKKAVDSIQWQDYQEYELMEPFYGKAPNITPSKNKVGI